MKEQRLRMKILQLFGGVLLVGFVIGVPDDRQELGGLIAELFGTPPPTPSTTTRRPAPPNNINTNENVEGLINQIFKPNNNNNNNQGTKIPESKPIVHENKNLNSNDCECVPYFQCKNGSILDNGVDLIDIRLKGPCDDYLQACCKVPDLINEQERITPRPVQVCGHRNADGVGFRITGAKDNEAQFGEFPWMVAILREEKNPNGKPGSMNVYLCGGAVIHPSVILTAAHCVNNKDPKSLKIRAGEWDTQTKNEVFLHQDRRVESLVVHERFHAGALFNDFALLFLSEPLQLLENVATVCLPEQSDNFDTARCFASGWGKDVYGKAGHYQVILKRVELPVVRHDFCQNSLRQTRLGPHFNLDSTFICAGGEAGKDTCQGDGGSPLVCPIRNKPGRYAQAGIVAWGIGCGGATPGVYANVASARQWIDDHMNRRNYGSRYYSYFVDS